MGASVSRNSVRLDSACEDWGSGVPRPFDWARACRLGTNWGPNADAAEVTVLFRRLACFRGGESGPEIRDRPDEVRPPLRLRRSVPRLKGDPPVPGAFRKQLRNS